MKKFLSGLPPLKIPSRAENDAIRKALEGNWEPEESPLSAFIDRPPPLPWNIEHELREACAEIVTDTGNAEKESTGNEWFNFSNPSKSSGQSRTRTGKKSERRDESQKREPIETSEVVDENHLAEEVKAEKNSNVEIASPDEAEPLPIESKQKGKIRAVEHTVLDGLVIADRHKSFTVTSQSKLFGLKDHPFRKTIHLEPLNTAVSSSIQRPRTAPTSHSSNASESAIASASTDAHPLSASTGITSVAVSPATKSHATGLLATSTSISARLSDDDSASLGSKKPSLDHVNELPQQQKNIAVESKPTRSRRESITASIKNFVRNRSRSISKSGEETSYSETRSSFGGALRNLSIRKNKSMGNLTLGSRSQSNFDKSRVDDEAPPVPKLDPIIKDVEYKAPVHIVTMVRPVKQHTAPATTVSLQPARANVVEVQGRSPKTSLPKNELSLNPPEALRKHSLASSSIDSCFTPPVPQTPDKHQLNAQLPHAVPTREVGGAGHIDILKAARSLESLRAQYQLQQQLQTVSGESPISQFPRSNMVLPRKASIPGLPSHPSSRPASRGTMRSASVHSSRSPSRASRAISVSGQPMPVPPFTAKYSIIPNTTVNQHARNPSQPSGLRNPVYAQSHISGISSATSSVVYLPSNVGRPGTSGGESPAAVRTIPQASTSRLDLLMTDSNSRRQTVTSAIFNNNCPVGIERVNSTTSLATSTAGTVNFSRKFTGNEDSMKRESVMTNLDVTALPPVPVSRSKAARLRRVFSSLSMRRQKVF